MHIHCMFQFFPGDIVHDKCSDEMQLLYTSCKQPKLDLETKDRNCVFDHSRYAYFSPLGKNSVIHLNYITFHMLCLLDADRNTFPLLN